MTLSFRRWAPPLVVVAAACGQPRPSQSAPTARPTVVVVSFDALGDRFLDRDSLPAFHAMMQSGVRAPFRPEFPSKTFPNHYSMATGLAPGQHGVTINQFYDPARAKWFLKTSANQGEWFGGEPIWVTAERQGVRTAVYFWTGSEAEIRGGRPSYWYPFDATVPDSVKLGQMMRWLRLPNGQRPNLVMMYSPVVDVPGHRYGPDAPQTFAGVRAADRFVAGMRDSLAVLGRQDIDLIVVSDHGLANVPREHDIDMDSLVPPHGVLVDDEHATFSIWQDPAGPKVNLDSLAAFYRRGLPHAHVYRPGEFPAKWQTEQNRRFGDVFLLADPGWEFVGTKPRAIYTLGEHGYDPQTPEMMGVFMAVGSDFQSGVRLSARENRTLRDLLVRLLRLQAPLTTAERNFGLQPSP